ncbi:MAG: hypothetical protein KGO50_19405 [Myxococcales bacterium]|nr:hypothetical protein [Myxococcales bacterium]
MYVQTGSGAASRLTCCIVAVALSWLAGCGTTPSAEPSGEPAGTTDAGAPGVTDAADEDTTADAAPVPVGQPCSTHADCGGGWCVGEPGCDGTWQCVATTPCSAAPPFRACTCDGVWSELAAGCPGERWAFADDALPDRFLGTFCAPQGEPSSRVDVVVNGVGFDAFNGQNVMAVFQDSIIGRNEPVQAVPVVNGQFSLRWVSSFDRSSFGYFVSAWFDTGNGLCEASESPVQWSVFNNFDLTDPLVIEVTPGTSQEAPCP